MSLAAVQRRQRLDNMITAYNRFVISGSKFIHSPRPQFIGETEVWLGHGGGALELRKSWRRENGLQHRVEFRDPANEHFILALAIHAQRIRDQLVIGPEGRDRFGM